MRVKLDENLPIQLKRLFTDSGHDAVTVLDEGMGGARLIETLAKSFPGGQLWLVEDFTGSNQGVIHDMESDTTAG